MTPIVPTAVRVSVTFVVTLLAIAATAAQVAYLDALWWHALGITETLAENVSPALILLLTAHAIVAVVCAAFAVALVLYDGSRQGAALGLGAALGAWSYLMAYAGLTLFRPDPGVLRDIFEGHFLLVEMIGLGGLIRFTALFPRVLLAQELEPSPTMPAVLKPAHSVSLWMLRPNATWSIGLALLLGMWAWAVSSGDSVSDAGLSPLMDVVRFCAAGFVVVNVRRAWRFANEGDREPLTWLVVGLASLLGMLAVLIGGNVLVAVTGFPEPNVAWRPLLLDVGLIGFMAALAMSILHTGRARPGDVLLRISSVCAVTTLGLFLAAGLEALFTGGVLAHYSPRSGVGTAIATAMIVSTYRSIVGIVQRMVPQA